MRTFETCEAWARAQTAKNRKLIQPLRRLIQSVAPQLVEGSKWGNGCWSRGDLPLLFIHAEKDHVQFGFFGGALLSDPNELLRGKGKYVRHVRISCPDDIDEGALATLIRKAVRARPYR